MITKICKRCEKELPLGEFYKHKDMVDGYLSYCKNCVKLRVKKYRENNIDKCRAYDRNRPNKKERGKEQRERLKNNLISYSKYKASQNKWSLSNRKKRNAHNKLRRAIIKGQVIKKDFCEICGKKHTQIQGHHYDYDKPLDVIWVCTECHGKLHRVYDKLDLVI